MIQVTITAADGHTFEIQTTRTAPRVGAEPVATLDSLLAQARAEIVAALRAHA